MLNLVICDLCLFTASAIYNLVLTYSFAFEVVLDVVASVCNSSTWEMEAENQKSKVVLGYLTSSKPTWAT